MQIFYGRRIDDSIVKSATTIMFMYQFLQCRKFAVLSSVWLKRLPILDCMFEKFSLVLQWAYSWNHDKPFRSLAYHIDFADVFAVWEA